MTAIFGDHVKWDQVKVFVGKSRPLRKTTIHFLEVIDNNADSYSTVYCTERPRQTCPITGWQAHYMDPRTGVPYADSQAYKVLTNLLNHEYVWNPSLGCYTDHEPLPVTQQREEQSQGSKSGGDAMEVDS